jgi:S-(hydroxymethyl)glutathione dehydrogenase/alcohol dehydrogenase
MRLIETAAISGSAGFGCHAGNLAQKRNIMSGFSTCPVVPEDSLIPVPKDSPLEYAGLTGCCIPAGRGAATNCAEIQPGDSVAVYGLGGVD